MKGLQLIPVALASVFLTTTALAANSVYVSGDVGVGDLATPDTYLVAPTDTNGITGASYQTGSVAFGVSTGFNHAFTPNLLAGIEFGYDGNGQSEYTEDYTIDQVTNSATFKLKSTDFHLLGTGTYKFNNGINFFGKAGVARVRDQLSSEYEINSTDVGPIPNFNMDAVEYRPMVAAGTGYQYKMVGVYFQYAHIFANDAQNVTDLFNSDFTDLNGVVSVDTFKAGLSVNIAV